jgi:hypothetical protein
MPTRIYIDLRNDARLRKWVKDQIRSGMKSFSREEAKGILMDALDAKVDDQVDERLKSEVTRRVGEALSYDYSVRNKIKELAEAEIRKSIKALIDEIINEEEVRKLIKAEIARRVGKMMGE